ncbi:quinone-interacting membrane-bound oxidoreductase complex subunit QmoC [Chloroflexota bacterium]
MVEPDTKFVREVIGLGGESLKKCFQCGSCSVVCSLSPDERPFPRKEMIWTQWGLKDRLLGDPDVWLCHQCTDCSTYCPRGAKPGDVLAAIRSYSIMHLALPGFLARALAAPKHLLFVLALPALLLFAFLAATGNLTFPKVGPEEEIVLSELIPVQFDAYIGMALIVAFVLAVAAIGAFRFWKSINEFEANPASTSGSRGRLLKSFVSSMVDILLHSNFGKCQANKTNRLTHLGIFYGFILLLLAAFLGAIYHFAGQHSPYYFTGLTAPVKIVGNLGALLLLAGCALAIYRRLSKNANVGKTTYFDWFLILTLFFVTISGIATEVVRIANVAAATYWLYLVHLWLMFMLLIYAPFSKGAHLIYRTLAMTYARQIGRETSNHQG